MNYTQRIEKIDQALDTICLSLTVDQKRELAVNMKDIDYSSQIMIIMVEAYSLGINKGKEI